ncbi:hypothetical protein BDR07DRAFT_1438098 [Suillus spraguei]|nr:hypothetical protein BDR07DRAFT_1438098 [Suillus spraguei]
MPAKYLNPRQSANTTDSNAAPQSTANTTPSSSQVCVLQVHIIILRSNCAPSSPQTTSVGTLTSSSSTPESTFSSSSTTSSPITTHLTKLIYRSSQPQLTKSTSLVSSTSTETSSSTPTSQPDPTSTTSSTSDPAPNTSSTASSSPSPLPSPLPSSISQNNPTSTTPTSTYGGQTTLTITSSYVTIIGPSTISTYSLIPTVISSSSNVTTSATDRTGIIAGSVIGGGLFLIFGLSVFFYRQRQRFKHFHFLDAINVRRRQALPNDTERGILTGPIVDGGDIDLSHIIDNVMGPSAQEVHYSQNSLSSSYYDSSGHESAPQTRERSNTQLALLEAAGLSSTAGSSMQTTPPSGGNAL